MTKRGPKPHPDILTPRQWEVLSLLREGLKDQQIADRLDISLDDAKYHVSEILSRLGVATRAEAAAWEPIERRPIVTRVVAIALGIAAVIVLLGLGLLAVGVLSTSDSDDVTSDGPLATPVTFLMTGASMEPTFVNGQVLDVRRYDSPVARGDVIVFVAPTAPTRDFLKRVIGIPGDRVRIDTPSGTVRVNGEEPHEPYVRGPTRCSNTLCLIDIPAADEAVVPSPNASPLGMTIGGEQPECETIPCYFVMGDNRQNSSDSRQGWLVPVDNIIGYVESPHS